MIHRPGTRVATGRWRAKAQHVAITPLPLGCCGCPSGPPCPVPHRRSRKGPAPEAQGLRSGTIDPTEVARAPADFDLVCESLTSHERARLFHLLIEPIGYGGREGLPSFTFQPTGIHTLVERQSEGDAA